MSEHAVTWVDHGREPTCAPNPHYPDGMDLDTSLGAERTCAVALPYPAARCGHFIVECARCALRVAITTAGRPDDPRSVKLACQESRH